MFGQHFLINTGSDVSIIPCSAKQSGATDLKLFAANNTVINTYGKTILTVDLKLRRTSFLHITRTIVTTKMI